MNKHRSDAPSLSRTGWYCVGAGSVEWYDFFLYATASAAIFPTLFFGALGPTGGKLASFATFALAFLARPIGGILFGYLGDRIGRRAALSLGTVTMGAATVLIGLLPTPAAIGAAAPVLLVALRMIQGLALGGQWAGSVLLLTEQAPTHRRGFWGSIAQLGSPIGGIVANGLFFLFSTLLAPAAFTSWGWRIPFLASVLVIGLGLTLQLRLDDSPAFRRITAAADRARIPVLEVLRVGWRQVLLAGGTFVAASASLWVFVTFLLSYGTDELGLPKPTVLLLATVTQVGQIVTIPLASAWSDRAGRTRVFRIAATALVVAPVPAFLLIDTGSVVVIAVVLTIVHLILGAMYGPMAALFSEMFPTRVRYSGASLGYQLGTVVGGGFAPIVATALFAATGTSMSVAFYLVVASVVTLASIVAVRDTSSAPLDRERADIVSNAKQ